MSWSSTSNGFTSITKGQIFTSPGLQYHFSTTRCPFESLYVNIFAEDCYWNKTGSNGQPITMKYSQYDDRIISFLHWARSQVLTWGHPWIWWRLLSGIDLLPVEVIISALAVSTCRQWLLKSTIACDKRKKFIWLFKFSINFLLKWMNI